MWTYPLLFPYTQLTSACTRWAPSSCFPSSTCFTGEAGRDGHAWQKAACTVAVSPARSSTPLLLLTLLLPRSSNYPGTWASGRSSSACCAPSSRGQRRPPVGCPLHSRTYCGTAAHHRQFCVLHAKHLGAAFANQLSSVSTHTLPPRRLPDCLARRLQPAPLCRAHRCVPCGVSGSLLHGLLHRCAGSPRLHRMVSPAGVRAGLACPARLAQFACPTG